MYKKMKIIYRMIIIVLSLIIIFVVNGSVEYFIVQNKIDEFKSRAEPEPFDSNGDTYYYIVLKKHDYEDASRNIITFRNPRTGANNIETNQGLGSKTDIFITTRNPMRDVPELAGLMAPLSKYFYIGHATINISDNGRRVIEVFGNSDDPEDNVVSESNNTWHFCDENTPNLIGLRIKDTTSEQRDAIVDYAVSKIGYPYNYTFLFNRNKAYYCTDLVSRAASSAGININYDYLATTGNDLIASRNTYIIYYRELVYEKGLPRYNVYFLAGENE